MRNGRPILAGRMRLLPLWMERWWWRPEGLPSRTRDDKDAGSSREAAFGDSEWLLKKVLVDLRRILVQ